MSGILIKIKRKVIDEAYALHGKVAIEGILDMIKDEIFVYLDSKDDEYFKEVMDLVLEEARKRKQGD